MSQVNPLLLPILRGRGGRWALYVCTVVDSSMFGRQQCLKFGPGCTYETPPKQAPYHPNYGLGWQYPLAGEIDLETGETKPLET